MRTRRGLLLVVMAAAVLLLPCMAVPPTTPPGGPLNRIPRHSGGADGLTDHSAWPEHRTVNEDEDVGEDEDGELSELSRPSLKTRAVKTGKSVTSLLGELSHRAVREAKCLLSSDWENVLLSATRPTDLRPEPELVEQMLDTVSTFVRDGDLSSINNPYRVTLRKLWAKMAECDWRTSTKAFLLLHKLLRHVDAEDAALFRALLVQMSRETDRKTRGRYFSKAALFEWGDKRESAFGEWACRYCTLVMRRALCFTGDFEELRSLGTKEQPVDDVLGQLLQAKKLLIASLACFVDREAELDLTLAGLEELSCDVHALYVLFDSRLQWVIGRRAQLFGCWSKEEAQQLLEHLVAFRSDIYPEVQSFLRRSSEVLELYGDAHLEPLVLPAAPPRVPATTATTTAAAAAATTTTTTTTAAPTPAPTTSPFSRLQSLATRSLKRPLPASQSNPPASQSRPSPASHSSPPASQSRPTPARRTTTAPATVPTADELKSTTQSKTKGMAKGTAPGKGKSKSMGKGKNTGKGKSKGKGKGKSETTGSSKARVKKWAEDASTDTQP